MAQNYYEVLGLDWNAEPEEIKKAYRSLAKTYHPDTATHPNAKILFEKISVAYSVLSDPEQKGTYDKELNESAEDKSTYENNEDEYSLMADYEYICEEPEHFLIEDREVEITGVRHLIIGEREYIVYNDDLIDIGGKLSFKVEGPERYLVDGVEKTLVNSDHFIQKGNEYVVIEGKPFLVRKSN